jgi:negative regulator of sigma E activity
MMAAGSAWLAGALSLASLCSAAPMGAQTASDLALFSQIDQAEQHREADLAGYTVEEHYTITNSHFHNPASAVVKVFYSRDAGKQYDIVSRSGPSLLAGNLLDSMLAEEKKLSVNPSRSLALLSTANYSMVRAGEEPVDGEMCEVIAITPKQKSPYVIEGRMWVDALSKLIVKIEGTTEQSPSFFSGKPDVIRDYGTVDGFALAQKATVVSSGFFAGRMVVEIKYVGYQITP